MLIDSGVSVELFADEWAFDADGNRVRRPSSTPVEVVGRVQVTSAPESTTQGQETPTQALLLTRVFPAGFAGRVRWDGRDWDVVGEPSWSGLSALTGHWRVVLRARVSRAVA